MAIYNIARRVRPFVRSQAGHQILHHSPEIFEVVEFITSSHQKGVDLSLWISRSQGRRGQINLRESIFPLLILSYSFSLRKNGCGYRVWLEYMIHGRAPMGCRIDHEFKTDGDQYCSISKQSIRPLGYLISLWMGCIVELVHR